MKITLREKAIKIFSLRPLIFIKFSQKFGYLRSHMSLQKNLILNSYHSFQKSALEQTCLVFTQSQDHKWAIHFTHKPQQDQGERKRGQADWQVKSIIYLKAHKVESTMR